MDHSAREVLLALADDELCMGQQHAAWIGLGPMLEEDLAFTSIGQDEFGHARALYGLLEEAVDGFALTRPFEAYRSCHFVEDPCPSWEEAFVRHVLYDEAEAVRWEALTSSTVPVVGDLARRALSEEQYHTRHARPLFTRLLVGTATSRARLVAALDRLLPLARGLFEATEGELAAVASGVVSASSAEQEAEWRRRVDALAATGDLELSWPAPAGLGGRAGRRSAAFGPLHAEMTAVFRLDPAAAW